MQLRISDPETFVDRIERPRPSSSKSSGRPAYDEIRRAEDRALSGWNSEGFAKGAKPAAVPYRCASAGFHFHS